MFLAETFLRVHVPAFGSWDLWLISNSLSLTEIEHIVAHDSSIHSCTTDVQSHPSWVQNKAHAFVSRRRCPGTFSIDCKAMLYLFPVLTWPRMDDSVAHNIPQSYAIVTFVPLCFSL